MWDRKTQMRQTRKLMVISVLLAIILIVSTYAWFIGMRNVNITSFNIDIATTDSLLLSLDGENWATEITMNQDMIEEISYDEHTNRWSKLIPISTTGQMDKNVSRMILYEKTSFTATPGGYRILANRVRNDSLTEKDGYVVFDLFVRNFSGSAYIKELNQEDEEGIFLTRDSAVIVSSSGVQNTGIENSVRVAFAPIGRVSGLITNADIIKGISCNPKADSEVTGICRTDRIWEPNNTKHVSNAIKYYNASCRARKGANLTLTSSYSGPCGIVSDGKSYPTYAINSTITSADRVDIYDGEEFNGYKNTSSTLLRNYPYFTDTMKMLEGIQRPTFMTLAPNSITKVRVYIYIEGQDIDNYLYAQLGKKIAVKFGFTKERFEPDDIDYDGPPMDSILPTITIQGDNPIRVALRSIYVDEGATANDNVDGDLTNKIKTQSNVDTSKSGTYRVTYSVKDAAGNEAIKYRYVIVE